MSEPLILELKPNSLVDLEPSCTKSDVDQTNLKTSKESNRTQTELY